MARASFASAWLMSRIWSSLEKIALTDLTPFLRPHGIALRFAHSEENHARSRRSICKKADTQADKIG